MQWCAVVITDWDALPVLLTAKHMAELQHVSIDTIWDRIQKRTMRPAPVEWRRPYFWNKDHVREHFERRADQSRPASRFFPKARERRRVLGIA